MRISPIADHVLSTPPCKRKQLVCSLPSMLLSGALLGSACFCCRAPASEEAEPAAQLVQSALRAELVGDLTRRTALLDQAEQQAPDFAPTHWQKGRVFHNGRWRSVEEAVALVRQNPVWQQYQQLRSTMDENVEDQARLARWCAQYGLLSEEEFHWRRVLAFDPENRRARGKLGLREYHGNLHTKQEIDSLRRQEKEAEQSFQRYAAELKPLRKRAASRDTAVRESALSEIRSIDDPAAIDAMCAMATLDGAYWRRLTRRLGAEGVEQFAAALESAIVSSLGQMPDHRATRTLLEFAVFSGQAAVRAEAAEQLKRRPKTDYVPLLLSRLAAPVEVDISITTTPNGVVRLRKELFQAGPESNRQQTDVRSFVTVVRPDRDDEQAIRLGQIANNRQRAATLASAAQAEVNRTNARLARNNQRIQEALTSTTGMDHGDDVAAWWTAWQLENELYSESTPTYSESYSTIEYARPPGSYSCFAAGTPVWTKDGQKSIEQILVGDQVLSQDPATGELAYCFVRETTQRPPAPIIRLEINEEQILTTRGHRFWVNGIGWQMAKNLKPESSLRGVGGPVPLTASEPMDQRPAYNLVVEDFHTFFVGRSQLLVHDNHCPKPIVARVPGMNLQHTALQLAETDMSPQ